jgi:hypothetical protein
MGGLILRLASTTSGRTLHVGSPTLNFAFDSVDSGVAITCCCPDVEVWEPNQNSVDPVVGLKGQRGMLAITKKGHWRSISDNTERAENNEYLRMEEGDIFVYKLAEPMRSWQCVISRYKVENGLRSKISEY